MMSYDLNYAEIKHLEQFDNARKLQARELSKRQFCEASWLFVSILFLTLIVGLFS